jgi:hypothetical protein
MTWVTDLSHVIDAQSGHLPTTVPGPARRLMDYLTRIVAEATAAASGHMHAIVVRADLISGAPQVPSHNGLARAPR